MLNEVHQALVSFHKPALDAANATARVSQMQITSAVLSIWSQGVQGFNAGCHEPKPGKNPAPEDLPNEAVQPLPGWPIYVANEAFGHMHCFAEGSLGMATEVMKRMNISSTTWHRDEVPIADSRLVGTDPWLLPGGAS